MYKRTLLFTAAAAVLLSFASIACAQKRRTVAVTIDDLPVNTRLNGHKARKDITDRLVKAVKEAGAPAIGFVNEGKLYREGKLVDQEVDLLRTWTNAGLELGNHTYSHMGLHDNPIDAYLKDITKGEAVTKKLLAEKGMKIRYFRHPYLHGGTSLEIKKELADFLKANGYEIAPVSIDNDEWIFAAAYDFADIEGDKELKKRIAAAYVPYMEAKTDYWERQSVKMFGREIAQVLLIHANMLNADLFGELAAMYKRRGYSFVTLEESLKDDAYRLPDEFTGRAGISWIHRWVIAKDRSLILPDEPRAPDFVVEASRTGS